MLGLWKYPLNTDNPKRIVTRGAFTHNIAGSNSKYITDGTIIVYKSVCKEPSMLKVEHAEWEKEESFLDDIFNKVELHSTVKSSYVVNIADSENQLRGRVWVDTFLYVYDENGQHYKTPYNKYCWLHKFIKYYSLDVYRSKSNVNFYMLGFSEPLTNRLLGLTTFLKESESIDDLMNKKLSRKGGRW